MDTNQDKQNCLKNLLSMALADGEIDRREMAFLKKVAEQLGVVVSDWDRFVRLVREDSTPVYPVEDRGFAVEVLRSLIIMVRKDNRVGDGEKQLIFAFAKSMGISRAELKEALVLGNEDDLFDSPEKMGITFLVITTDFEKADDFTKSIEDYRISVRLAEYRDALHGDALKGIAIVCLHGAGERETTLKRCRNLLDKNKDLFIVPVLGRYQGNQVKYLHELGLKRCVVEPLLPVDIANILKEAQEKENGGNG